MLNGAEREDGLWVPIEYFKMTPEELEASHNGCGPGGVLAWLVPDSLLGKDITDACMIHDLCYKLGDTIEDKQVADRVFLNNMLRIVSPIGGKQTFIVSLRQSLALIYYKSVVDFGGPAFWSGKNAVVGGNQRFFDFDPEFTS